MKTVGAVWRVVWYTPYEEPPGGLPRVVYERFVRYDSEYYNQAPPDVLERQQQMGRGWMISWSAIHKPGKVMDRAGRAAKRRGNLQRRMEKRYPLFAETFTAEEIAERPQYFYGEDDPEMARLRQEALDAGRRLYERWREAVGETPPPAPPRGSGERKRV